MADIEIDEDVVLPGSEPVIENLLCIDGPFDGQITEINEYEQNVELLGVKYVRVHWRCGESKVNVLVPHEGGSEGNRALVALERLLKNYVK